MMYAARMYHSKESNDKEKKMNLDWDSNPGSIHNWYLARRFYQLSYRDSVLTQIHFSVKQSV